MTEKSRTFPKYAIILLAALFLAGGLYALNEISLYTPDSTRYLVWAKSIAAFDGYRDLTAPEPARYVVHGPLYALMLAPIAFWFPYSIIAAKTVTLMVGVFTLLMAFRWLTRSGNATTALLGSLLLALHPLFFLYSTEVLSDVPFVASLLLAWILTEKLCDDPLFRPGLAFATALAVAAALLLREIGISVLLSGVVYLLSRKRYRETAIIFVVPALFYAGWYARNELIVAVLENPSLTNAKIFSYHFLTGREASIVQEFGARIANNLEVYSKQLGDLFFAPVYFSMQYDLVSTANPPMAWVTSALGVLRIPLAMVALSSMCFGLWTDLKQSEYAMLRLLFLAFYGLVMLTYPINDIRFLLPILIVGIFYSVAGCNALLSIERMRHHPKLRMGVFGLALFCMLPNLIWDVLFARTSAAFTRAPAEYIESVRRDSSAPTHFTKAFRLTGEWIMSHTDAGAVVMTQWKDLALWVGDRKVLNVDQTLLLDDFENQLRDYRVEVLVSQIKKSGVTEFAIPMHQSRKFAFRMLHRIGNTEIYQVGERGNDPVSDDSPFARSLTAVERGDYQAADSGLAVLWTKNRLNIAALYMLAAVKSCAMRLGESDSLFGLLRSYPQAGSYIAKASMYQQLNRALVSLDNVPRGPQRSAAIAGIAAGYWNIGMRFRARELIDEAFREDSASVTAMVFGFHFALRQDDLASASRLAGELGRITPAHPLAPVFKTIVNIRDTLAMHPGPVMSAELFARLAQEFSAIGLHEDAIDCLSHALGHGKHDAALSILLADMYIGKKRLAPARNILLSLLARNPEHAEARSRLESLSGSF